VLEKIAIYKQYGYIGLSSAGSLRRTLETKSQNTRFAGKGVKEMRKIADYSSRIQQIEEELKTKTLSEAERDRNLDRIDYADAGYGYKLKSNRPKTLTQAKKDAETPELDKLEKLALSIGVQ
jgi:hypothetical protein